MTSIPSAGDSAREAARLRDGKFGTQPRPEAEVALTAPDGVRPDEAPMSETVSVHDLEPLPARVEPRLNDLTTEQHEARERAYLGQIAALLRQGERPIAVVEDNEPHSYTPMLDFPDYAQVDPFHVSANTDGVEPGDAAFREMNIVAHDGEEFPRLPHGFDEGDAKQAAEIIRAYIVRRIVGGQKPSGLHAW